MSSKRHSSHPEGETDIVEIWKRRLPLLRVMTGTGKGRTTKPLREQIDRYLEKPETMSDGQRLKQYCCAVMCAQQLRTKKLVKLPENELEAAIKMVMKEGFLQFPTVIQSAIVEHASASFRQRMDITRFLKCAKPWLASESEASVFDPLAPLLSLADTPLATRITIYRNHVWSQFMAPLLMSGGESMGPGGRVRQACAAIREVFSSDDILDLDNACAKCMTESITAASAIEAVLMQSTSQTAMAHIQKLRARMSKTDHNILTIVANALTANTSLCNKAEVLERAAPSVAEFGEVFEVYAQKLGEGLTTDLVARYDLLKEMSANLSKARSSEGGCIWDSLAERVLGVLKDSWLETSSGIRTHVVQPTAALLKALQECFAEAIVAYSLGDILPAMHAEVRELVSTESSACQQNNLMNILQENPAWEFVDKFKEVSNRACDALQACNGMQLNNDLSNALDSAALTLGTQAI